MPSFADSIFLFVLALLMFGPKKLPVLARELGKWMGEFRRASNEFKMQMEDELRASEQADRQKKIAAMEAAAPIPPALDEPEEPHPHLRNSTPSAHDTESAAAPLAAEALDTAQHAATASTPTTQETRPVPIATSGNLQMMPPDTGLPTPRSGRVVSVDSDALAGLVDAIPETGSTVAHTGTAPADAAASREEVAHGN